MEPRDGRPGDQPSPAVLRLARAGSQSGLGGLAAGRVAAHDVQQRVQVEGLDHDADRAQALRRRRGDHHVRAGDYDERRMRAGERAVAPGELVGDCQATRALIVEMAYWSG